MTDYFGGIRDLLIERGHTVDHRKVRLGEDIDGYDALITAMLTPMSIGSCNLLGALWAMSRGMPTLMYMDDWQVQALFGGMEVVGRVGEKQLLKTFTGGRPFYNDGDIAAPYVPILQEQARKIGSGEWGAAHWTGIAFDWGDKSILEAKMPTNVNVHYIEPSSLVELRPLPPTEKRREWVMGSLNDATKAVSKFGTTWPVAYWGKKYGVKPLPEAEFYVKTAESWGVLSHPYWHAGSGWYRTRFFHAAKAGNILLANPDEVRPLGAPYLSVALHPQAVERFSDLDLATLAKRQAEAIEPYWWGRAQLGDELERLIAASGPF